MYATKLICRSCGSEHPLENRYSCESCGGILEVTYDYDIAFAGKPVEKPEAGLAGMWKYCALLPVREKKNIVTLSEGDTPLLEVDRIAKEWGCDLRLMIKAELLLPTGSFKDRPTSVGVSVAREAGHQKIVVASSGNASASASAYAARAGMDCVVFIPDTTDINKVVQAQSYGAQVFCVKGNYSRSYDMAKLCAKRYGWANVTSTFINPYTVEGDKTPAYELYHQLEGQVPDYILIPIGTGPLLVGIYKGFQEMMRMGLIDHLPAMIGVQAKACEPVTRAYDRGTEAVEGWNLDIHTAAGGISDPLLGYEGDGALTLSIVKESGGRMISLTEDEILEATRAVETKTGLYCEPTGAVTVGAVRKLWHRGLLKEGALTVCCLTGHGFKYSGRQPKKPLLIEHADQLEHMMR